MQAVPAADRDLGRRAAIARDPQQPAAAVRLPGESLQRGPAGPQGGDIQQVGTQIKDGVPWRDREIVDRARVRQRDARAVDQLPVDREAVQVQRRLPWIEPDAEVDHLPGRRVELGVGRKRADLVQLAVEVERTASR